MKPTHSARATSTATQQPVAISIGVVSWKRCTSIEKNSVSGVLRLKAKPDRVGTGPRDRATGSGCFTLPLAEQDTFIFNDAIHFTTAFDQGLASSAATIVNADKTIAAPVPEPPAALAIIRLLYQRPLMMTLPRAGSLHFPRNHKASDLTIGQRQGRLVLVRHRNIDPPLMKHVAWSPGRRRRGRLFLWCERARVLVGPGVSEAPPIAPGAARPGSALFRL